MIAVRFVAQTSLLDVTEIFSIVSHGSISGTAVDFLCGM